MPRWIVIAISIATACLQTLLYPWLSLWGGQLPLVPVVLLYFSYVAPGKLVWAGFAAGLSLDLLGVGGVGWWTIYYTLAGGLLKYILSVPKTAWWWRPVWLWVVIILQPLFGQASQQQWSWSHAQLGLMMSALAALAILPCYWLRKKEIHI